jgi:NAD(P)-dependent dehydrogenase (short-subunit alcohol dehydrogenase family)
MRTAHLGFARAGCTVAIVGRKREKNQRVLKELQAVGHPAMALRLDLTTRDQLEPTIERFESTLGC